ncbi:MAG: ATP-binding protein [Nanoarchaeota archaeon]
MVYVPRELEKEIKKHLSGREILGVVGARQCGKTTLVEHILKGMKGVRSISFDDAKTLSLFEKDIDSFIELHVKGYACLFIDEVQYAKDGGRKLKYIHDTQKTKIIISGSSAPDLSIQSMKYLVGRIFIFRLYPFSYGEFLTAKDEGLARVYAKGKYGEEVLAQLNRHLEEFLIYGGYPRVVLAKETFEKETILRNIYSTFLLREIRDILGLSDNDQLVRLLKSLSLQAGNMINYNELSSLTGFTFTDLKRYLRILEETYVCKRVGAFYTNKRTELVKVPKIQFFDLGFRNVCIDNFSTERSDRGAMLENLVFIELVKHGIVPKYWQTKSGAEVDFVLDGKEVIPIEVKSAIKMGKATRSYQSFLEKYGPKRGYIVSQDFEMQRKIRKTAVHFLPFVKLFEVVRAGKM